MKTAFAVMQDRIAPVFDTAKQVLLVESGPKGDRITSAEIPADGLLAAKALRLAELEVTALVCGAISRNLYETVASYGIVIIPFVAGTLSRVVETWQKGEFVQADFAMPGYFGRRLYGYMENPPLFEEN